MCGFAGFVRYGSADSSSVELIGTKMAAAIKHRGPDDSGLWRDDREQLVLVHRRLSIVDLSPAGHQPMTSRSGRYTIAFNGEIYNHQALRTLLNAAVPDLNWRGHSDTETLLACVDAWGLKRTLQAAVGMFALALWDREARTLMLARDRMGEKPLYYGLQRGTFLFASELKAIKAHPAFIGEVSRDSIALQLRHNYIPAPYTIYKGISKLLPGHVVCITLNGYGVELNQSVSSYAYWNLADTVNAAQQNRFAGTDADAIEDLHNLLQSSVRQQMMADVPLGAFLSGGIDSSAIVSLMQSQASRPVKTFTIGFHEAGYNEAEHAKAVARHIGTDHTELYVSSQEALDVVPRLAAIYDEPFSDSSQIPTFLVSEMTRQHVTVSLSGDGGDELFGGYTRYLGVERWWSKIQRVPQWSRRILAAGLQSVDAETWETIGVHLQRFTGASSKLANLADNVAKTAGVLSADNSSSLYKYFISHWSDPSLVVLGSTEPKTVVSDPPVHLSSVIEQMMALDALSYLPDDILVKVDRAAMAVSLETRVPFLDYRVVEFAWGLPQSMKIRDGQGKWILRQVLRKYVPVELFERPKMGFGVPIGTWLRGPLRDWAEALLDPERLKREGIFSVVHVRAKWEQHLSGKRNWQYHLWDVLMFQAWLDEHQA